MANPILGIIGGGQLGSMLAQAASKIKIKTVIFSDDLESPAKNFADIFIFGKYDNEKKIEEFINQVDIVTLEFENIPYQTLNKIKKLKNVQPDPEIIKVIQNRYLEKQFINSLNIKTTEYKKIKEKKDVKLYKNLIPGILKTTTLGYDGKGQYKINSGEEIDKLEIDFKNEFVLEKKIDLKKEISVIVTRFGKNSFEIYEPIENLHKDQILNLSRIPAKVSKELILKSQEWAILISEKLDYIGTLCVEFFIDKFNNLYVNEIAPRVHNSGHLTINSHNISQFENHIRAVCRLEKIKILKNYNAKMINILGQDIEIYRKKNFKKNEYFYDYLKKEPKEKRKMGHLTIIEN